MKWKLNESWQKHHAFHVNYCAFCCQGVGNVSVLPVLQTSADADSTVTFYKLFSFFTLTTQVQLHLILSLSVFGQLSV